MHLRFGASLKLTGDFLHTRPYVEQAAQGEALQMLLNGTDPDIVVILRPRQSGGVSEALVQIDKPQSKLPEQLKKYVEPQKFYQFQASNLSAIGDFTGTYYCIDVLRAQIMDKVVALHKALHPSQPLGLKNA